jgi:hypothetical protein
LLKSVKDCLREKPHVGRSPVIYCNSLNGRHFIASIAAMSSTPALYAAANVASMRANAFDIATQYSQFCRFAYRGNEQVIGEVQCTAAALKSDFSFRADTNPDCAQIRHTIAHVLHSDSFLR